MTASGSPRGRRTMAVRAPSLVIATAALALSSIPAAAQLDTGRKLPVELFQGVMTTDVGGVRPYVASVAVLPTYAFTSVRLGLHLSLGYDNPGWEPRMGARVSSRVTTVFRDDIGFILGGEATWTRHGDARLGAGLTFDVDGLVRVGVWGGWDERSDGGFLGLTLGADPTSWFACVPSDIDPSQCANQEVP